MDVDDPDRGSPGCVVGIGASAGGVDALTRIVSHLPGDMPAALLIVLHVPATGRSLLAPILDRRTDLDVRVAEHDDVLEAGRAYVAPPDRHLVVADGRVRLDRGPKENGARPAVDPMFRSLAAAYGPRAVGVVLSGALGDGSSGALAIKLAGGTVIVQDPLDATVRSMPESASRAVGAPDAVLPTDAIGPALATLADKRAGVRDDRAMSGAADRHKEGPERPAGPPSGYTCPECSGPLWAIGERDVVGYRCRVGHAYSEDSMIIEQGSAVEAALWSALEALEERAEFLQGIADRHGDRRPRLHDRFERAAQDALGQAELIRRALGAGEPLHALDVHAAE
ncbi:MAG TPA: chemotaxis protein CheB [Solirubrobacteraceae bacterium]|nr:chemotaxis protein CheB [Solirubrobacteraceae bacterium]